MKSKAFTLLEVLIATAIFAVAMVLAGGVVAQTVRYQYKIKYVRLVANESQRISDLISRDIKLANTAGSVKAFFDGGYNTYSYKNGLALFNCNTVTSECSPMHFQNSDPADEGSGYDPSQYSDSNSDDYRANTLVIFYTNRTTNETNYKIYYFHDIDKSIYLYSGINDIVQLSSAVSGDLYPNTIVSSGNLVSSDETETIIKFGGFAPENASSYFYQPYVLFDIMVETSDYNSTTETSFKAKTEIRSAVTGRSYNL